MSARFLAVVPCIDQDRFETFHDRCGWHPADVVFIDNTPDRSLRPTIDAGWAMPRILVGKSRTVAGAWNIGAGEVIARQLDWLVICSSSLRFGPAGGQDFTDALAEHHGRAAVDSQHGWHLIAIARWALLEVGLFDEGFAPAYFEDTDWLYRAGLAGVPSPRENDGRFGFEPCDAECPTAETLRRGLAAVDMDAQEARYVAKWGGTQGHERFIRPFDGALRDPLAPPSTAPTLDA